MAKINEQQFNELDNFLAELDANLSGEQDIYSDKVNNFLKRVKANLKKYKFNASGNLSQSLAALPIKKQGNTITVSIEIEDYWEDLENGTQPQGYSKENRKKLQPKILEWIGNKPELQSIAKDKKGQLSLSYAIATNILKKGTIKRFGYKGKPFLTEEIPQLEKDITKEFE
jgi:hypothetical protein